MDIPATDTRPRASGQTDGAAAASPPNTRRRSHNATCTRPISTGTSTSGPMTVAKATSDAMPKIAIATAMASSKLFPYAVNARVVLRE